VAGERIVRIKADMNNFDEAIAAPFQKIDEGSKSVKIAMSSAVAPVSLRLERMCAGVARLGPNATPIDVIRRVA
jgi:hypothetical protein